MPANTTIKIRQGIASLWTSSNPILASGEPGFETDRNRFKIGDGVTSWNSLNYASVVPSGFLAGSGINITNGSLGISTTIGIGSHTHIIDDITNFASGVADEVSTTLTAGSGILLDFDNINDTLTVSVSGLNSSYLNDFNSSVSGLIPVKNIIAGSGISVSSVSGSYTISSTNTGGGATITNYADNRILTSDGTSTGINGESNLLFDGSTLTINNSGVPVGSGTSNYVARWTSNNVVGTGIIYDNSTNVGIGTNSPLAKLDIRGDVVVNSGTFASPSLVTVKATGTAGNHLYLVQSNDDRGWKFKALNDGNLYIQNSYTITDTTRILVDYINGRVGIGTTSPNHKLDVAGTGNFSQNLLVNGTPVSVSGHTHSTSDITDFNASVSGLLPTIANSGDNRLLTSTGSTTGINAESNLTFNGTTLGVTGVIDIDNLRLDGNTISSTNSNGNIVLAPNGTGDVQIDADTLRVGDSNTAATITTNGTGNLTLNTNSGTNSGTILINQGSNGNIELTPNGTGDVYVNADTLRVGDSNTAATITTNGTGNLTINTNNGTNAGSIVLNQGNNGNIIISPNGTGKVGIGNITPLYNLEVGGTINATQNIYVNEYPVSVEFPPVSGSIVSSAIDTDASNTKIIDILLTENITLNNPTNSYNGATIRWRIQQDGSGGRTVTLDSKFQIPSSASNPLPWSTGANVMDTLAATYHAGRDKWDIVAFVPGY